MTTGRERVLDAAYELFSRDGVGSTGIDAVVAKAGVAKMTLYRNFRSKDELAVAFLERREERWTYGWMAREVQRRADSPAGRLLAIFDVFGDWFARDDYEGCSFIKTLLEHQAQEGPVHDAAVRHLANVRGMLSRLAAQTGVQDPEELAHEWQLLMKGAIVSAAEGDAGAATRAKRLGRLLLRERGVDA